MRYFKIENVKDYLEHIHKLQIFNKDNIVQFTGSENSAKELLRRYKKSGLITQIRRNRYAANDLANKTIAVSKYEIGSNLTPTSYLAYHAAIEYHGLATQIFNTIYVATEQRFADFDFEGTSFVCCRSKMLTGVENQKFDSLIRVTNIERTIIDCIDNIGLSGGLEELILALVLIPFVKEDLLVEYLNLYNKHILYQKAGFILSSFQKELNLSDNFFIECKSKTGKNIARLTNTSDDTKFSNEWKLYAPANILSCLEQGGTENV
jgi:predicted transcriptional regulator of viral defense system